MISVAYWCVCQLMPQKQKLALHCLQEIEHYSIYAPRLREHRMVRGRKVEVRPLLFVNYIFVQIVSGWWSARWAPGVSKIVLGDGAAPARVPDQIIAELKRRERDGAIELSKRGLRRGDRIRILRGPFQNHLAIFADMKPRDRIEVLLQLLGSTRHATLESLDVEPAK